MFFFMSFFYRFIVIKYNAQKSCFKFFNNFKWKQRFLKPNTFFFYTNKIGF